MACQHLRYAGVFRQRFHRGEELTNIVRLDVGHVAVVRERGTWRFDEVNDLYQPGRLGYEHGQAVAVGRAEVMKIECNVAHRHFVPITKSNVGHYHGRVRVVDKAFGTAFLCNDFRAIPGKHLGTGHTVPVVVRIHHVFHGLVRNRGDGIAIIVGRGRIERIGHDDAVAADEEQAAVVAALEQVYAVGDLFGVGRQRGWCRWAAGI